MSSQSMHWNLMMKGNKKQNKNSKNEVMCQLSREEFYSYEKTEKTEKTYAEKYTMTVTVCPACPMTLLCYDIINLGSALLFFTFLSSHKSITQSYVIPRSSRIYLDLLIVHLVRFHHFSTCIQFNAFFTVQTTPGNSHVVLELVDSNND